MKKFMLLALFMASSLVLAQDVDTVLTRTFYKDTLTATIDTIDVAFRGDELGLDTYDIVMYTTSGTDTVKLYVQAMDGVTWYQVLATDMTLGGDSTSFVITTTPRDILFPSPGPTKFRLVTLDGVASTVFIIGGRRTFSSHL